MRVVAVLGAVLVCGDVAAAPKPSATLRLTARCDTGELEVALSARIAGKPVFRLDDVVHGSPGMAKLVSAAEASDAKGALPLVRRDGATLELVGSRAASGVVTLRYRARSIAMTDRGARYGLRHDATGIGGLGAFFFVLPESRRRERIAIEWAPATGCPGMQGLASVKELTGELAELRAVAVFFGKPRQHAAPDGSLNAAWFGTPAFDTAAASEWAGKAYAAQRAFFGDRDRAPYRVFVRVVPGMGERANGMGQPSSMLSAIGPSTPYGQRVRTNLAHEMLHRWLGMRLRIAGAEGLGYWFTEGFTVHYANVLLLRAGLVTPDEFLAEVNGTVTRHVANPRSAASNAEIARDFTTDDAASIVPYTRGALYAAELDAAIRRASRDRRSLDDLIRGLYRTGPREVPVTRFRAAVAREAGRAGAARFDAVILRGAAPDPPSDAFGPCFERVARAIAGFELGFDDRRSLGESKIRGLVAGSAAAKAGLREGDTLVELEATPMLSDREVRVTIDRGKPIVIRYLPAGPTRPGFSWQHAPARSPRCSDRRHPRRSTSSTPRSASPRRRARS
jgi:predicted metalloprotease with PDZ domain